MVCSNRGGHAKTVYDNHYPVEYVVLKQEAAAL